MVMCAFISVFLSTFMCFSTVEGLNEVGVWPQQPVANMRFLRSSMASQSKR